MSWPRCSGQARSRPGWAARTGHQAIRRYAGSVAALASQLHADPSATTALAEQLAWLRRSASGAALCGPSSGAQSIDIGLALARRQVVLFPLDLRVHGPAGLMIARLVLADLSRTLSERAGAPADYLVWINGCDALDESTVRRCDRPRLGSRGNDDRQHRVRDDRWRARVAQGQLSPAGGVASEPGQPG